MKPLPRYFIVESKLIKVMYTGGKVVGQNITTGASFPPAHAISKGIEITEKEFIKEKAKILAKTKANPKVPLKRM